MQIESEKRPRQYAFEIAKLPTNAERVAALKNAPEHLRGMIWKIVKLIFDKKSGRLAGTFKPGG